MTTELTEPTTQKARGIYEIQSQPNFKTHFSVNEHHFFKADHKHEDSAWIFPVFVRPCPVLPKHGFVDSRIANSTSELNTIHVETKKADPDSEVAIAPIIRAYCSAIAVGNKIFIGPGNDGATSGTGTVELPTATTLLDDMIKQSMISQTMIDELLTNKESETLYCELVYSPGQNSFEFINTNAVQKAKLNSYLVQLRSGPKLTTNHPDFIPHNVKVENIIKAEGDLLEWEAKAKEFGSNTVIENYGGSLASHYAVHGILNNIPVITSFIPEVGQELTPNIEEKMEFDEDNFFRGFYMAMRYCNARVSLRKQSEITSELGKLLKFSIGVLHNATSFIQNNESRFLGFATGIYCSVNFALCRGEYRHHSSSAGMSRNKAYLKFIQTDFNTWDKEVIEYLDGFYFKSWSSGYGGLKWGKILEGGCKIWNACLEKNSKLALEELNKAIHLQHNGGWSMNKVLSQGEFDKAASTPALFMANNAGNWWYFLKDINRPSNSILDERIEENFTAKKIDLTSILEKLEKKTTTAGSHTDLASATINYIQIRQIQDGNVFRLQYKTQYTYYERNLDLSTPIKYTDTHAMTQEELNFTSQAIGLLSKTGDTLSLAGTNAKYHRLYEQGKFSIWYGFDGKRIVKKADLLNFLNHTFHIKDGSYLK